MPYRKALRQYRKKKSEEFIPDSASDPTSDDYAPLGEPEESDDEIWLRSVKDDPLQFVLDAFPWGEAHNDLALHEGPDEWQKKVLTDIGEGLLTINQAIRIARASGHGIGKALGSSEPVLTPFGWREIKTIKRGDLVATVDGTFTKVIGVYPQGERDLFKVTLDDGCGVVVDGDHLWETTTRGERKHGKLGNIHTTREIAATLTFPNGPNDGLNHCLPTMEAIAHETAMLPIEPYLLGFWLGDGTGVGRIGVHLAGKVAALAAMSGGNVLRPQPSRSVPYYGVTPKGIGVGLRQLGLANHKSRDKFIPRIYLHASKAQRTALLQGLLDTDGTLSSTGAGVTFDSMSLHLADGISELVRSLGGVARRGEKRAMLNGRDYGTCYRVFISLPKGLSPFRIPEKANLYKPQWGHINSGRVTKRFIKSVESVGRGEAICIRVAHPSHLFITRDHIVTHNTALVAWIILWAMSTMRDARIIVTANTEVQLRTKSWPELGRWHRLSRVRGMFTFMATALYSSNKEYEKTWRCDAITWSEARPEAFAGLHNQGKRIVIIFDEASWIPDIIWETTEGALTDKDTQIIWCAFGNPTRNTGRFRECFNRFRDRWNHEQIDSRTVRISNKDQLKRWQTDYGEDSDFFRVRVRGQFPRVSSMQFIPTQLAEDAMKSDREVEVTWMDPLIIGVDVARYGDNRSVICFRRGRDARTIPWIVLQGVNTMTLAGRVAQLALELKPDAIFVDEGGVGGGVVDRLQMLHIPCIPVNFGAHADYAVPSVDGRVTYRNKATEMWGSLRSWLPGGMIPNDPDLLDELISREYGFTTIDGKDAIVLESKMDMRSRNVVSPDKSDAIALTFAFPVGLSDHRAQLTGKPTHQFDYDPMATAYQAR